MKECLETNWISSRGRFLPQFESQFADYIGVRHGVATTSGTTALHLALAASEIGPGDEVLVPAFTMIASVLPILYQGATPVLVEAEPETWNLDTDRLQERITPRTRAILPVHIYGHPVDMRPVLELAADHGLQVIEDAAEAHGAEYRGERVGGMGDVGCFSFYANKIITTGEGGMLVTDNADLAQRAKRLKDLAFLPERRFLHRELGYNYRMTNLQAAIGLAQLERADAYVAARRRNAARYRAALAEVPGLTLPVEKSWAKNVYWMYTILIEEEPYGEDRVAVAERLQERGIETRPTFLPMHRQPALLERGLFEGEKYPVADALGETGLNLPSGSNLTGKEIDYVCDALRASPG